MSKELISRYATGYKLITEAIAGLDENMLTYKPAPASWSIKEIVIHLADTELVAVHRIKSVLSEDKPLLTAFDQDAWAERMAYNQQNHLPCLELFKQLRENMVKILEQSTEEDFLRVGIHNVAGEVSVKDMVAMYSDHVDGHIRQMQRVKEAYQNR